MRVMAFASQKGGSGKTTLAGHIAVRAERAGAGPVAIIDTDPRGSLSDRWNARRAATPAFAQTFISRLRGRPGGARPRARRLQRSGEGNGMSSGTPARLSSGLLSRKGMAAPSAGPETGAHRVASAGTPGALDAPSAAGARRRPGQVALKHVRVSLRLNEDRNTRLKPVATQRNRAPRSLLTEAIDEVFIRHAPDLHGISASLRRGAAATASGGKIRPGKRDTEDRNGPSRSR